MNQFLIPPDKLRGAMRLINVNLNSVNARKFRGHRRGNAALKTAEFKRTESGDCLLKIGFGYGQKSAIVTIGPNGRKRWPLYSYQDFRPMMRYLKKWNQPAKLAQLRG